jgi:hypothetical protein
MINSMPTIRFGCSVGLVAVVLLTVSCNLPFAPDAVSRVTISTPTPSSGSVIPITPIGIQSFIQRGSGVFSVPMTVESDREVDWAVLRVYLFHGNGAMDWCGHNLPDAPTWGPFEKGEKVSVTISGWQLSGPCEVTSIRAWLHTRNSGSNLPPTPSETVASGTLDVRYSFR